MCFILRFPTSSETGPGVRFGSIQNSSVRASEYPSVARIVDASAVAQRVGVTALTVYRWELPATAAEARRPRGRALARLEAYARAHGALLPSAEPTRGLTTTQIERSEYERILPVLDRIQRAELRRPILPPASRPSARAVTVRTPRRHHPPRETFLESAKPRIQRTPDPSPGRDRPPISARLARQRTRATQRHRTLIGLRSDAERALRRTTPHSSRQLKALATINSRKTQDTRLVIFYLHDIPPTGTQSGTSNKIRAQ